MYAIDHLQISVSDNRDLVTPLQMAADQADGMEETYFTFLLTDGTAPGNNALM